MTLVNCRHQIRYLFPCALVMALLACEAEQVPVAPKLEARPVPVEVATLESQEWQGVVTAFGVVQAAEQINISLDFSGVVKRVLVEEGDSVERGQLLLELDTEKQQLRVRQAAEAVQKAHSAMEEARLNLERRRKLAERETVSREVLDNAELALNRAAADYREALASQQLAERILADSHVTSPVNGVVEKESVESGEAVMAGSNLLTLQAADSLEVRVWIGEGDVPYINKGDQATVTLSSLPGRQIEAIVESVGVNAHSSTGNYPVELIIEPETGLVRPGMTATVDIQGVLYPDVLLLPEAGLVDRGRRKVVFIVRDGVAQRVEPILGAGFSDRLLILSGLDAGDQVIISNLQRVLEGKAVEVVEGETAQ